MKNGIFAGIALAITIALPVVSFADAPPAPPADGKTPVAEKAEKKAEKKAEAKKSAAEKAGQPKAE